MEKDCWYSKSRLVMIVQKFFYVFFMQLLILWGSLSVGLGRKGGGRGGKVGSGLK